MRQVMWSALLASLPALILLISGLNATAHWTLDLASQFLLPALSLAILALGLAAIAILIGGPKRVNAVPAATMAAILAISGPGMAGTGPRAPQPAPQTPLITVYQHNTLVRNPAPERIVDAIEALQPDVIALVESHHLTFDEPLGRLAVGWPHAYFDAAIPEVRTSTLRLYSRFPLREGRAGRDRTGFAWLRSVVETPDGDVTIMVVHLTRPWPFDHPLDQMRQVRRLLALMADVEGPFILMGDFNSVPWGRVAKTIRREHVQPLYTLNLGLRGTWPARLLPIADADTPGWPLPLSIPIDLTFHTPEIVIGQSRVLDAYGSDHRAILFDFAIAKAR